MSLIKDIQDILKKDWKLLLAVNIFYFGLVIIGALIALSSPDLQLMLLTQTGESFSEGPLSAVGEAYQSGDVLRAAGVTLITNFFLGTLAVITIPSLIFPIWAPIMGAIRALMWGIMLIIPVEGVLPLKNLIPHYLTILLEGEAYVVAIFACVRQIKALVWPKDFGEESRLKAYLISILDNAKLLVVVILLLTIAALYEAWEVQYFAGILN
ncbi:hypothetical protein CUJ83_07375 [Methanocella sp. CWC-04]|uniref:Stage II sporulation protein M n=1 Tax=Methanooceanicella nereidis TaxID=2052831 RepID=A0AAP2RCI8_9EURY|nr:hypothetical protein [Methanocella sp. CWC-04]MCD1294818.1 hypothetical protein [Methanocella sp. CWC-04]